MCMCTCVSVVLHAHSNLIHYVHVYQSLAGHLYEGAPYVWVTRHTYDAFLAKFGRYMHIFGIIF